MKYFKVTYFAWSKHKEDVISAKNDEEAIKTLIEENESISSVIDIVQLSKADYNKIKNKREQLSRLNNLLKT